MSAPLAAVTSNSVPPDKTFLEQVKGLALDAVRSRNTRRVYNEALTLFLAWYESAGCGGLTCASVQQFLVELERRGLAPSTIQVYLSAVRKLAAEAAANQLLAPAIAAAVAGVRGPKVMGTRAGNWLTASEVSELLALPDDDTLQGFRDRAILALLIGCGLRRSEISKLRIEDFALRDARWVLADVTGKGKRVRTVPVPAWVKALVDQWTEQACVVNSRLFRAINKGGVLWGEGISADTVWAIARKYGVRIGQSKLAPDDLRRTCAKLCRAAGGSIEQIQMLLGHASAQTTERYLGTRQELVRAVNDSLPIELPSNVGHGLVPRKAPESIRASDSTGLNQPQEVA